MIGPIIGPIINVDDAYDAEALHFTLFATK